MRERTIMMERNKSVIEHLPENGPIRKEMRKPQIKYIKYHNYGVRKLWRRIKDSNDKTPHR